jgi:hypothetical protein
MALLKPNDSGYIRSAYPRMPKVLDYIFTIHRREHIANVILAFYGILNRLPASQIYDNFIHLSSNE